MASPDGFVIPTRVQKYRAANDTNVFAYARVRSAAKEGERRVASVPARPACVLKRVRHSETGNEYSNLWQVKTFLVTAETLPNVRRRIEVRASATVRGLRTPLTCARYRAAPRRAGDHAQGG